MWTLLLNPRVIACIAVAGALAASHWWAYSKGGDSVRIDWREAEAEAQRLAARSRAAGAAAGHAAAVRLEADRDAIRRALQRTSKELEDALNRPPLQCPRTVGDAVVPGALGVRLNDIDRAIEAGATAGQPAGAVPTTATLAHD